MDNQLSSLIKLIESLKQKINDNQTIKNISKEFVEVEINSKKFLPNISFKSSLLNQNMLKNRYCNILANESTRFKLNYENKSDYINANWINPSNLLDKPNYIATQGPIVTYLDDFWKMVWLSDSSIIICLAKEVEKFPKFDIYWNDKKSMNFGEFNVSVTASHNKFNELIIRDILLTNTLNGEIKKITQYHYLGWPDHSVPSNISHFAKIINETLALDGPFIVHCSAGVGRTGVFIVVRSIIEEIFKKIKNNQDVDDEIDLRNLLCSIRKQRYEMVQSEEQYEFCYLAILHILENYLII